MQIKKNIIVWNVKLICIFWYIFKGKICSVKYQNLSFFFKFCCWTTFLSEKMTNENEKEKTLIKYLSRKKIYEIKNNY